MSSQKAPTIGSQPIHVITVGDPGSPTAREVERFSDVRTARYYIKTDSSFTWTGEQDSGAVGVDDATDKPVHIVPREGLR